MNSHTTFPHTSNSVSLNRFLNTLFILNEKKKDLEISYEISAK